MYQQIGTFHNGVGNVEATEDALLVAGLGAAAGSKEPARERAQRINVS
jgi:hypothetical protein